MSPPIRAGDIAAVILADLWHQQPQGEPVTTTVDPGRSTKQIPPHPGDVHAQRIRAALKRLRGGEVGSAPTVEEVAR